MAIKRHMTVTDFENLKSILPKYKTVKIAKDNGVIKGQSFILEGVSIKSESFDLVVIMR